jgi:hypothetical protein
MGFRVARCLCLVLLAAPAIAVAAEPLAGKIDGQTYRNEFFGLSITVPADWKLTDKDDFIVKRGDASLFKASQTKQRTPGRERPSMSWSAYGSDAYKNMTPVQFLTDTKREGAASGIPVVVGREIHEEKIGGVTFACMEMRIDFSDETSPGGVVRDHMRILACVRRGYVLSGLFAYESTDDFASLEKVLQAIKFDDDAAAGKCE